jgi:hypothetical protein
MGLQVNRSAQFADQQLSPFMAFAAVLDERLRLHTQP